MKNDVNRGMEALWKYVRSLGKPTPPDWIGLTEYEIDREANLSVDYYTFKAGAEWAEQRLKDRNS